MTSRKVRSPVERMLGYARVKEARDPNVSAERLHELAADDIIPVRLYTAPSFAAPPAVLLRLASDEEESVRWCVLLNPEADEPVLRRLAERERAESAGHPAAPRFAVRSLIVHHPNASSALHAELLAEGACGCGCGCPAYCGLDVWRALISRWREAGRF
ncbi:hypothetical protein PV721_19360 [Streptomyces sp. MB09-01]|uniref:hypothetical protein n=1 Tax=Streptomyces sp. MB09-01 TaxID=3028666 RepID=UPI0029B994E4|nr:hypothetical protein [Streptomyces sp. MB09-01]MDX3536497.1 hypothetical protein [Streptomyces sp. MB09-01]